MFSYAIGLKFPNLKENPDLINRKFNLQSYITEQTKEYIQEPLVIFPEVFYILKNIIFFKKEHQNK